MDASALSAVSLRFTVPLLILGNFTKQSVNSGVAVSQIPTNNEKYVELPSGYKAFPDIGVAYKYHDMHATWQDARKNCSLEGASLAVIDSQRKFNITFGMKIPSKQNSWVGIHNFYEKTEWSCVHDGSPMTLSWYPGYPKDIDSHHCTLIYNNEHRKILYYNVECSTKSNYFCEIPLKRDYRCLKSVH